MCSDEPVERDFADAQVPAPERLQSPLDLVELEAASPPSLHLEVKRTTGARHNSIGHARGRRCISKLANLVQTPNQVRYPELRFKRGPGASGSSSSAG